MSERQNIQSELADFLRDNGHFNAPYGIIEGMAPLGAGKKRVISFGVSRLLDASLDILQKNKLMLQGEGPLARTWGISYGRHQFNSPQEFKDFITEHTKGW